MNIALFSETEINQPLSLKDERGKHIIKVLHKKVGETFEAGIINGEAGLSTITQIDENFIHFDFSPKTDGKLLHPVTLIVGFPRPIQLKRLFRDVAGLGVEKLYLCGTELGEKSYMDSNIVSGGAAEKALLEGTVQAKSTHVPELKLFSSVKECLAFVKSEYEIDGKNVDKLNIKTILDNVKPKGSLFSFLQKELKNIDQNQTKPYIYAAIGSERGWTDNERELFEKEGFASCSMGERVLRTETATTVATTLIMQSLEIL